MPQKKDFSPVPRTALYIRVSTEEQVLHGYSLEAQREALECYAKAHSLAVVGCYIDEGKSARKPYRTRREFMRLLSDVEANKLDLILFIKLDRWFRSVADYHEIQRILEKHHVSWQTTQEDYETVTASGRLKVNIMLAVAQDEADRTSERIKFVFENKVARGEAITGKVPIGFQIENKHLVHDPEKASMVLDLFNHYAEHGSKHGTIVYAYETYNIELDRHTFTHMLQNPLYKGEYHGMSGYCEPLISSEMFDRLNERRSIRTNPAGRIYLFTGLVVCGECGHNMTARYTETNSPSCRIYYRCNKYSNFKNCTNGKLINELKLEQWLLDNVEKEIRSCLAEFKTNSVTKKKPMVNRAVIERKLEREKALYINGIISLEECKEECGKYTAQLAALKEPIKPRVNVKALENFLSSDFKATYANLDREKRRDFWRSIIKEIRIDSQKNITISFA